MSVQDTVKYKNKLFLDTTKFASYIRNCCSLQFYGRVVIYLKEFITTEKNEPKNKQPKNVNQESNETICDGCFEKTMLKLLEKFF